MPPYLLLSLLQGYSMSAALGACLLFLETPMACFV